MYELKEARLAAGLSVKELSELSKTPITTIYCWEANTRQPPALIFEWLRLWMQSPERQAFEIKKEKRLAKKKALLLKKRIAALKNKSLR